MKKSQDFLSFLTIVLFIIRTISSLCHKIHKNFILRLFKFPTVINLQTYLKMFSFFISCRTVQAWFMIVLNNFPIGFLRNLSRWRACPGWSCWVIYGRHWKPQAHHTRCRCGSPISTTWNDPYRSLTDCRSFMMAKTRTTPTSWVIILK